MSSGRPTGEKYVRVMGIVPCTPCLQRLSISGRKGLLSNQFWKFLTSVSAFLLPPRPASMRPCVTHERQ